MCCRPCWVTSVVTCFLVSFMMFQVSLSSTGLVFRGSNACPMGCYFCLCQGPTGFPGSFACLAADAGRLRWQLAQLRLLYVFLSISPRPLHYSSRCGGFRGPKLTSYKQDQGLQDACWKGKPGGSWILSRTHLRSYRASSHQMHWLELSQKPAHFQGYGTETPFVSRRIFKNTVRGTRGVKYIYFGALFGAHDLPKWSASVSFQVHALGNQRFILRSDYKHRRTVLPSDAASEEHGFLSVGSAVD